MKKHFQSKHFRSRKTRLIATLLCGILLFSVTVYWRDRYLKASEYVYFPMKVYTNKTGEMRSKNYQLQTQEISPSVR